jgi:serine phosphatase RsbU (regulator of sigma subunit)
VVQRGAGVRPIAATPILLVDDDEQAVKRVRSCLVEAGIGDDAVIWVQTLSDALAAFDSGPRCVLLGLNLPDADGYAAIHKLVETAPQIPVIVLTGRDERDGVEAVAAGAQDFLTKHSLSGELLERSIRYAVERGRVHRAHEQLRAVRMSATEKARLERGLLPTPMLDEAGVSCLTYYQPGRDHAVLGGDFFDVVQTGDGRVRAVIGDVMGHGPDEAALGVHLRVAWRTLVLAGTADADVLPTLARLLDAEPDAHRRYVTVCDMTLEGDSATVRSAGHPPPIVCVDGACSYPELGVGPPLGVSVPDVPATGWPENRLATPAGSSVVLYTDGLLDAYAVDELSATLGMDELLRAVQDCVRGRAAGPGWMSQLLGEAPGESIDDTAMLVLTVQG